MNVAARLEGLFEPGGICVSGTAHDQLQGKLDFAFTDAGEQQPTALLVLIGYKWHQNAQTRLKTQNSLPFALGAALGLSIEYYDDLRSSISAMIETRKVPKNLFDLAKALGRWESEGGSTELQGSELGQEIAPREVEERILRCLGAAVILQWNDLPTGIQRILFEDAASMSDPERRWRLKVQMARFLHTHKDDAE